MNCVGSSDAVVLAYLEYCYLYYFSTAHEKSICKVGTSAGVQNKITQQQNDQVLERKGRRSNTNTQVTRKNTNEVSEMVVIKGGV